MKIDKIDKQILNELYNNGRESLLNIKDQVFKSDQESMSHTGVRKRIVKLENSKILKVQGNLNINSLNYHSAFILMEIKSFQDIKKIIKAYKDCPRVFLLSHVTGRYNLILGIVGQNLEVIQRYINFCGPTNKEGILHSEILLVSNLETPNFLPVNLFSNKSQESNCGNVCKECDAFLDGKCNGCGYF